MQDDVNHINTPVPLLDIMNPEGLFKEGVRRRDHALKDICAFSARLLPEFDKRQSIKAMFSRKPSFKPTETLGENTLPSNVALTPDLYSQSTTSFDKTTAEEMITSADSAPIPSQGTVSTATVGSAPASPDRKRASSGTSSARLAKKAKASPSNATSPTPAKGQQSLKGFFIANSAPSPVKEAIVEENVEHTNGKSSVDG